MFKFSTGNLEFFRRQSAGTTSNRWIRCRNVVYDIMMEREVLVIMYLSNVLKFRKERQVT